MIDATPKHRDAVVAVTAAQLRWALPCLRPSMALVEMPTELSVARCRKPNLRLQPVPGSSCNSPIAAGMMRLRASSVVMSGKQGGHSMAQHALTEWPLQGQLCFSCVGRSTSPLADV